MRFLDFSEWDNFHWAIFFSVFLHIGLMSIRLVDPQRFDRIFQDTALEVILVNAKPTDPSPDKNLKAQALAQHQLKGGGTAEKKDVIASTFLPPANSTEWGESVVTRPKTVAQLQAIQQHLLQGLKSQLQLKSQLEARKDDNQGDAKKDEEEQTRQLLAIIGAIEKRIQAENSRPRKTTISPATAGVVFAQYYDRLKRRIEEKGTNNFPVEAGRKLYGQLVMSITLDAAGKLLSTKILKSSGNALLDNRAQAIVREAGPFGAFTDAMRQSMDQIEVISRFQFTNDQTLDATLFAPNTSSQPQWNAEIPAPGFSLTPAR